MVLEVGCCWRDSKINRDPPKDPKTKTKKKKSNCLIIFVYSVTIQFHLFLLLFLVFFMFSSNLCLFVFLNLLYFHLILQFSEELRGSGCLRPQRSGFAESGRCLSKLDHSGLNFIMCQDFYSVSPTVKLCVHCDLRFVSIRIGLDLIIVTVISRR